MNLIILLSLTCVWLNSPIKPKPIMQLVIISGKAKVAFPRIYEVNKTEVWEDETFIRATDLTRHRFIFWNIDARPINGETFKAGLQEVEKRLIASSNYGRIPSLLSTQTKKFVGENANVALRKRATYSAKGIDVMASIVFDHGSMRYFVRMSYTVDNVSEAKGLIQAKQEIANLEKNWKWLDNTKH